MPELPEVQTTVDGLNAEVKGLKIVDAWTDYNSVFHAGKNNIKNPEYFSDFKKDVVGAKVLKASRYGKNVLIHLSNPTSPRLRGTGDKTILVHMKMTGHFLYGKYEFDGMTWSPAEKPDGPGDDTERDGASPQRGASRRRRGSPNPSGFEAATLDPLLDPYNRHIHLIFTLSDKKHLAFSDTRKFAKIFIFETKNEKAVEDLMHLGPDPLSKEFTYKVFRERLHKKPNWKIKQTLMDQEIISGIGNIYSDEILWAAGVHPLSITSKIPEKNFREMHKNIKVILKRGIDFGGDSMSDYRNIYGLPGKFQNKHNVYRRKGELCPKKDGGKIERIVVGARSAHFCGKHQKLYK